MLPRVQGNPYEAEFECFTVKSLPGGQTCTSTKTGVIARDSSGRELEQQLVQPETGEHIFGIAKIYDPVGATDYIVDRQSKTILNAHHISQGMGITIDVGDVAIALPVGRVPEGGESIGRQVIGGLPCAGYRHTTMRGTLDYWISEELQAIVLLRVVSETGESTFRIYNICRREPDSGLFSIPQDYRALG